MPSHLEGINSFNVSDEQMYDLTRRSSDTISKAIQKYGLSEGLRQTISAARVRRISSSTLLSTQNQDAFYWAIHKHITERERLQSMPKDIIDWNQALVAQLPESLQLDHILNSGDVHKWGHDQMGNSGLVRAIDRMWTLALSKIH